MIESVDHPRHYTQGDIECIDAIRELVHLHELDQSEIVRLRRQVEVLQTERET